MKPRWFSRQSGMSLIELMIALVIGTVLVIGIIQVFLASRAAYQLSEGLSRVQENGRFALNFLQRDIRMGGHFGCINDQAHLQAGDFGLATTFVAANPDALAVTDPALRFAVSVEGFDANGTAPGNTVDIANPAAGWTRALDASIASATSNRVAGSDILILRYLVPQGVPVTSISMSDSAPPVFSFEPSRWDVLRDEVANPGLFAVSDCLSTTVFQAEQVSSSGGTVSVGEVGGASLNLGAFHHVYTPGQTMLHRAESLVYYVGSNGRGGSSLYRVRYAITPGGIGGYGPSEELVEGIENMQLLFGFDRQSDIARPPTGFIDRYSVALTGADSTPAQWLRLGAVQIGLLAVSDRASAEAPISNPSVLGVSFDVPDDGRMRSVYQSTIAVRNRLYGQ